MSIVPLGVVLLGAGPGDFRRGLEWSDDHCGQSDDCTIARGGHCFQGHVSGALDGPFVILFEQDRAHEPDVGVVVGKDADDVGSTFDFPVEPFEAVGGVNLRRVHRFRNSNRFRQLGRACRTKCGRRGLD